MAVTTTLSPARVAAVTALLRPNLDFLMEGRELAPSVALRESFRLQDTSAAALLDAIASKQSLANACHESPVWHHQVAVDGNVTAFAETTFAGDPDNGEFLALMRGALARDIDRAIHVADEQFDDGFGAALVRIRAVSLYFLLLTKGTEEHVVIAYSLFSRLGLSASEVLTIQQFATSLRRLPRGGGVRFNM